MKQVTLARNNRAQKKTIYLKGATLGGFGKNYLEL